jgi:hypothetical protein
MKSIDPRAKLAIEPLMDAYGRTPAALHALLVDVAETLPSRMAVLKAAFEALSDELSRRSSARGRRLADLMSAMVEAMDDRTKLIAPLLVALARSEGEAAVRKTGIARRRAA